MSDIEEVVFVGGSMDAKRLCVTKGAAGFLVCSSNPGEKYRRTDRQDETGIPVFEFEKPVTESEEMQEERARFETHMCKLFFYMKRDEFGKYLDPIVFYAWTAWQAALRIGGWKK